MKNGIEKEYKLLLTKEQFTSLCSHYKSLHFIKQTNTYYDTDHHDLQKQQGAMRIREKENTFVFTLKMPVDEQLMEFECNVPHVGLDVLEQPEIKDLLASYGIHGPFKQLTSLTTQRAMVINEDAELCFDINEYHNTIDYEIEYEYKRDHEGWTIFQEILKPIAVSYEKNCDSKIKRALDALS